MGPTTAKRLSDLMLLPTEAINQALYHLENEGFVFRENYNGTNGTEWCERRWEGDLLPARVADYDYQWLDMLCVAEKMLPRLES
jgi:hypothetical protein